ncbi:MAG: 2-C-methyl-D-erythritol 4-phosphate cytidylyltransferase, partial [Phascolarctobacterium sp.]|nr:2-C-methyl-D-erythritol 4-phosphate cytidylyltransferase [Candidatus Phascolarctobacterium equi]
VLQSLDKYDAVNVGNTPSNTVVEINAKREIVATPDRAKLIACQTPQGFRLGVISKAYELAMQKAEFAATDDCGVVAKMMPETKIFVATGDANNHKLTQPDDLPVFEYLFRGR